MTIKGRLVNKTQNNVLAEEVTACRSMVSRIKGLLGTSTLRNDEACWLIPCSSIHTIGMRYAIDVYFLDKTNKIISIFENMVPGRFSPLVWKAHSAVEVKTGIKRPAQVGDILGWEAAPK